MNHATTIPARTVRTLAVAIIIVLAIVSTLGMSGVIHLPFPLVWILPETCLIIGTLVILWEATS
jgi:hypothetical protein